MVLENESTECWARLRFAIVGPLLAAPPGKGELGKQLRCLAAMEWTHPLTKAPKYFGVSTIERWYYLALSAPSDPVAALRRKTRCDRGYFRAMSESLAQSLEQQYRKHSGWSYLLHSQNLAVLFENEPEPMPSYATIRRFMKKKGWLKRKRRRGPRSPAAVALAEVESREVRSYEAEYVHGLWHLDFHEGSLQVLLASGEWTKPQLFAVMDDRSRLICHMQWYLSENAENLSHGLEQGLLKRGLPRSLLSDNGSAMTAEEVRRGFLRLGIHHKTTLAYSPHQNGKQEVFWAQVEGRLLAMLEGCKDLTLQQLNEATQAWVEREYHRSVHSEINQAPLERFLDGPSVGRDAPDVETLHQAFCAETTRKQRRSDGTLSLHGMRFEVPNRFRHVERIHLRYARWDLSRVYLIEESEGQILARIFPIDKVRNADARRGLVDPCRDPEEEDKEGGIAPLLAKYIEQQRRSGLPPAYCPQITKEEDDS